MASCSGRALEIVYVDGGGTASSGVGGDIGHEGGNGESGSGGTGADTGSSGAASSSASGSGGTSSNGSSSGSSSGTGSSASGGSGGLALDASCPTSLLSTLQTVSDAASAIAGRWQICAGLHNVIAYGAPSDTVGIEFTQATTGGGSCAGWGSVGPCMGGYVYYLVQGAGGLVRGQGNAYQIWYAIDGAGAGLELALFRTPNNDSWTTVVSASASPREFYIETILYTDGARLVPAT